MPFTVTVVGHRFEVICPPGAKAGQQIRVALPERKSKTKTKKSTKPSSSSAASSTTVQTVIVPAGVYPGMPFRVRANGSEFQVKCPPNAAPGQRIQIRVPAVRGRSKSPTPLPPPHSTTVQTVTVTVPAGVKPGMPFRIRANGQIHTVTCPGDAWPGKRIQVRVAAAQQPQPQRSPVPPPGSVYPGQQRSTSPVPSSSQEFVSVVVPAGVSPGGKFRIRAKGREFVVTCPPNAWPGQTVRVPVPISRGRYSSANHYQQSYV